MLASNPFASLHFLSLLRRRCAILIATAAAFLLVGTAVQADTITTYRLKDVSFTIDGDTWDITGHFTFDNFDDDGTGLESDVKFIITGPSFAYTGTYRQKASASNSGNGFYALGTRTDGTPAGKRYDVVLDLEHSQIISPQESPVVTVAFVVHGYGKFCRLDRYNR